jgi:hypothetical protein
MMEIVGDFLFRVHGDIVAKFIYYKLLRNSGFLVEFLNYFIQSKLLISISDGKFTVFIEIIIIIPAFINKLVECFQNL